MSESMFYLRALFASVDEAGRAMDELETYLANAANAHAEGEHVGAVHEADRGAEWSLEVEERADGPSVEYRNLVWARTAGGRSSRHGCCGSQVAGAWRG